MVSRTDYELERKRRKLIKRQELRVAFESIISVALRDNSIHTNIQTKIDKYTGQLLREVSIRTPL